MHNLWWPLFFVLTPIILVCSSEIDPVKYFSYNFELVRERRRTRNVGNLNPDPGNSHGTKGQVSVIDDETIIIKNFSYDGTAPAAYFLLGEESKPTNGQSPRGIFLKPQNTQNDGPLGRYNNQEVTLKVPRGSVSNYKYLSVWCKIFKRSFAHVKL